MRRVLILLLIILPVLIHAQDFEVTSVNLTVQDGLASNNVYCAIQDIEGYIWFATETGVNRFNGRSLESFYMEDGLADNEIFRIDEDSQGRLWFSAFNGKLSYYHQGEFYNAKNTDMLAQDLNSYYVNFFEDSKGTIWLTTRYEVLALTATGDTHVFSNEGKNPILGFEEKGSAIWAIPNKIEQRLKLQESGKFLDAPEMQFVDNGVAKHGEHIRGQTTYLTQNRFGIVQQYLNTQMKEPFDFGKIGKTNSYHFDELWVCTYNGVFRIDFAKKKRDLYFKGKIVTHLLEDSEGGFWFTTLGEGVHYVPSMDNTSTIGFEESFDSDYVSALFIDEGRIWVGGGGGAIGFIKDNQLVKTGDFNPLSGRTMIKGFEKVPAGKGILVAAEDHLLLINEAKELSSISMTAKVVRRLDNGKYLIGLSRGFAIVTYKDILRAIDERIDWKKETITLFQGYPDSQYFPDLGFIIDAEPFKEGFLYSSSTGIRYMAVGGEPVKAGEHPILQERINDIFILNETSYALATHGFGIYFFENGSWSRVSTDDGLSSNICKKIVKDEQGDFWVATNAGVNKISRTADGIEVKVVTRADGLASEDVHDLLILGQKLITANSKGISIIDINLLENTSQAPVMYLRKLVVDGQEIAEVTSELSAGSKMIEFEFDALHYRSLDRLGFEYRLIGSSDKWQETPIGKVNFGALPPGDYQFQVRAVSASGIRSDIVERAFTQRSALIQKWWFILILVALFVAMVIWIAARLIKNNRLKSQRELAFKLRIADAERKALQSQLNPHFIFNSLNSIQAMVLEKEPEQAYEYLEKFSKLIRRVLKFSDLSMIRVNEEIETLTLYMELERVRMDNNFDYQVKISEVLTDEPIPSMTLQPYVENAIWHGIMPLQGERQGKITIDISKNAQGLYIEITDNGVGRDTAESTEGFGTRLADQLAKTFMGAEAGAVEVEDLFSDGSPCGTKVCISIWSTIAV